MARRPRPPETSRRAGQGARERAEAHVRADPLGTALAQALDLDTPERSWRLGAEGEEEVGRRLDRLPRDHWTVIHDRMLGPRRNVDHLVIGPAGIFAIDAKVSTGEVWTSAEGIDINDYETDIAEKAREVAQLVAERLEDALEHRHWVEAVVVFVDSDLDGRDDPRGVTLLDERELVPWLLDRPRKLSRDAVAEISRGALSPRTWYRSRRR